VTTEETASAAPDGPAAQPPGKASLPIWQETILLLAVAVVLAVVIKAVLVQAFYIPSESMEPGLVENDRILVQKWSYWSGSPERGDVVVFKDPGGWLGDTVGSEPNSFTRALEFFGLYPTGDHLVKRVIGVGGDRVACCDDEGRVTINGAPLDESDYLMPGMKPGAGEGGTFDVTVPEGKLWVLGDNRAQSADSRVHIGDPGGGFIPVDDVVGKVFLTVWPPSRISVTDHPEAFDAIPAEPETATDEDSAGR
jgi:signal peptidase I